MLYKPVSSKAWNDNSQDKLKLDWNESDVLLPEVLDHIKVFLSSGNVSFYPSLDNEELLVKISGYNNVSVSSIELTPGSDYGHEMVLKFLNFENRDSSVVIFNPTYDNFRSTAETIVSQVHVCNLNVESYKEWHKFDISNYSLVYLSNPNNPTTDFLDLEILEEKLKKFPNIFFLIDEAYIDFDLSKSASHLLNEYNNLIISRTFSKSFGLAAFRIGYILATPNIICNLKKFNNIKHINAIAKISASVVLDNLHFFNSNIRKIKNNKILLLQFLESKSYVIKTYANGGNFVLIQLDSSSSEFVDRLMKKSIYIRPLNHLPNLENFVRITIPINRLEILLKSL